MVSPTAVGTLYLGFGRVRQPGSAIAHPAAVRGGNADHHRIVGNVLRHHGASGNEAVLPECYAADDGRISSDRRASSHQGSPVLMLGLT